MHMISIAGRDAEHSSHFCNETAGRHAGCEIMSRQGNRLIFLGPLFFVSKAGSFDSGHGGLQGTNYAGSLISSAMGPAARTPPKC